ncbi:peptidase S8/S53 domain-containing protein [Absidia repens]|uniref:Peptidase S8/S53 domain-containing protein n=1 Tax=Absidia repens TaxID=90262 RepID=A0A1X2ITR7_9FUNG|nr:peptidase S8/S53 domain-containing protein [Absidia repens]
MGQRYTVRFRSPPENKAEVQADQKAFLDYLQQHHINVTVRYKFTNIMNGMSVQLVPTPSNSTMDQQQHLDAISGMINQDGDIMFDQGNLVDDSLARHRPAMFLTQTLQNCPYIDQYWPGKRYARPNVIRYAPAPHTFNRTGTAPVYYIDPGSPNLKYAHAMTEVDRAKRAGWTGNGIKVGILDSGIDYNHPSLGGCFGEGCLVQYGYDLVGDDYTELNDPIPDSDPHDSCDGHGTHVAGILAANDTFKGFEGVAPGVTLGVWRIFGCHGDTDDDIILAAADMAVSAGMDVINLSLGGGVSAWAEDALAVALSAMADRGIIVVVAQGNEGRDGIARTPSPAIGEHVIAVGSVDNASKFNHLLRVYHHGRELASYEYVLIDGSHYDLDETNTELTTLVTERKEKNISATIIEDENDTGCHPIIEDVQNKVVLVKGGECDLGQKALEVQNAGGSGVLIYNTADLDNADSVDMDTQRYSLVQIPVISLSGQDGAALLRHYYGMKANSMTSKMTLNFVAEKKTKKMVKKMFSTWGPDPELHLKPDIVGVGGSMYSTFPMEMGAYTTMSGTSMATPYISGCVALLMQATKEHSPISIIRHLLNSAEPIHSHDGFNLESMARQGAGLVQIYDSILASSNVTPYKIPLNDTEHFQLLTQLVIENTSNATKKYQLEHLPAMAISGYDFRKSAVPLRRGQYQSTNGSVYFEPETITLGRQEKKNVTVRFEQPSLSELTYDKHGDIISPLVYGGFLQLRQIPMNGDKSRLAPALHVPYYGVLGNQRDLPIFDTVQGYPYIGHEYGTPIHLDKSHILPSIIPTYNFEKDEKLHLFIRLGSPTALLKCELIKSSDNQVMGYVSRFQNAWVPRNDNSLSNHHYTIHWDGQVALDFRSSLSSSQVELKGSLSSIPIKTYPADPGVYRLRLSALKIFGRTDKSEDWETWDSFEFGILG